ncbi:helix-turn-helix transcriptional regulator [Streptomyces sp. NBC_01233]|uniref:helix-turn-helix transcriptional regulator n=1 Tax=Streptomyces sp. NBC_01233 TaxID=2903787 RepID=UPI002E10A6A6|nr:helix-turn-helix domain-containing protein [Streptomyces sp. NBC_01233]
MFCNACAHLRWLRALAVARACGIMGAMTRDWRRLGEALKAARAERGMEQQDVAEAIGVKRGALHNIEKGAIARVTPTVLAYARLVGWTDPSVEAVLCGGDPVLREDEEANPARTETAPEAPASDLSVLVQQSLREGPLLDARVAEVRTPSGKVRATIVIRGEDGATDEELLAALRSLRIDVTTEE